MEITESIPVEKFNTWTELFKQTSGRFLQNPFVMSSSVRVNYTFNNYEDYVKLTNEWRRLNTPIVETKRGFWARLKVKLGL
jgi:hypothetical protein